MTAHPTQRIDETDFLVVDVETTGLSAGNDRVVEIGAVKLRGSAVDETFGSLVDPRRPIGAGAYAVNRISPEMLVSAPVFETIAHRLWHMMEDSVLVAYNAQFDLSFLVMEFRLIGYPPITNTVVDALALARQLLPGLQSYGQENVAATVGISLPVRHRALEDAMTTAQLFQLFVSILKAHDCCTCTDLQRRDIQHALSCKRIGIIEDALRSSKNLWIKYLSPTNAEVSDRVVTPRECVGGKFGRESAQYLVAFCHSAHAERNFRVDRILDLRVIGDRL